MQIAIGPSFFNSTVGIGTSTAALEAQLDKCKIQLADWVSCPSHATVEGKAKITEISNKISAIEQRLKAADTAGRSNRQTVNDTNTTSNINTKSVASILTMREITSPSKIAHSAVTYGIRLDVFA